LGTVCELSLAKPGRSWKSKNSRGFKLNLHTQVSAYSSSFSYDSVQHTMLKVASPPVRLGPFSTTYYPRMSILKEGPRAWECQSPISICSKRISSLGMSPLFAFLDCVSALWRHTLSARIIRGSHEALTWRSWTAF
jgi:hypothetical protein